jgi:hypothetical protein
MNLKRAFRKSDQALNAENAAPWKTEVSIASIHAATTFEDFEPERARLIARFLEVAKAGGGSARLVPSTAGWPSQLHDVIRSDTGVAFEAGYDIEDRPDGSRLLHVTILRVLAED